MKQYQINSKLMTKSVLYIKTIDDPMKVGVWIQVLERLGQLKHGHAASGKKCEKFSIQRNESFSPHLRLSKFQSGNWAKSESNQIFLLFLFGEIFFCCNLRSSQIPGTCASSIGIAPPTHIRMNNNSYGRNASSAVLVTVHFAGNLMKVFSN